MKIGPGCYTIAPARTIAVQGPMFPWQTRYRIAKQEVVNSPWINQLAISEPEVGWRLFTMEPLTESYWMQLDIRPVGTVLFGESPAAVELPPGIPTLDDIAGAAVPLRQWTPAKARVLYPLAGGTVRELRFDINTGVTIAIPPTNKIEVDLLVWDEDISDVASPDGEANILRGVRFATLVSCKATAVQYANPVSKPHWTQLAFINSAQIPGFGSTQIPLIENAGRVQLLAGTVDPGDDLALGNVRALMRTEFERTAPGVLPVGLSLATPQFPIDFDTPNNSKVVPIPGSQANIVRIAADAAATPVFNVAVIQELDC